MIARSFFVLICLAVVYTFAPTNAEDAEDREVAEAPFVSAVDQMLKDFAAAVSTSDARKAEGLFVPPDDTLDGKNRQDHIREMKKDWKRSKERGQKMTVEFTNTVIIVRTKMLAGGDEGEAQPIPLEFKVALTKDGCKILAMKYLKE